MVQSSNGRIVIGLLPPVTPLSSKIVLAHESPDVVWFLGSIKTLAL
jgi:hypothetical protein